MPQRDLSFHGPVYENSIQMKIHDKIHQSLLNLLPLVAFIGTIIAPLATKETNRICRLPVQSHGWSKICKEKRVLLVQYRRPGSGVEG